MEDMLVAYEINDEPLPVLNDFPVYLGNQVCATYRVK
jgi:hypothetical protein